MPKTVYVSVFGIDAQGIVKPTWTKSKVDIETFLREYHDKTYPECVTLVMTLTNVGPLKRGRT